MSGDAIHILIVDDDPSTRFLTKYVLEKHNSVTPIVIHEAVDGASGLQYISAAHTMPDIVLLDIYMPGMNGVEFLIAYKKLPSHKNQQSAIYILSSETNVFPEEYRDMVKGLIEKPLTQQKLIETLSERSNKV